MNNISNLETIDNIKLKPETFDKYYNKIVIICNDLPYNFRKKLRYLRECSGKTREKLEENSHISVQTIKEIETNNSRGYSLETIIALCIGMHLPFHNNFICQKREKRLLFFSFLYYNIFIKEGGNNGKGEKNIFKNRRIKYVGICKNV